MLLAGLGFFIAVGAILLWLYTKRGWNIEAAIAINAVLGTICLFVVIILAFLVIGQDTKIERKIEMYEAENAEIEMSIGKTIDKYLGYEAGTYKKMSTTGGDATVVVSAYPELASSELVAKQVEIYVANKTAIKALKEEKINQQLLKWWLYFGGNR